MGTSNKHGFVLELRQDCWQAMKEAYHVHSIINSFFPGCGDSEFHNPDKSEKQGTYGKCYAANGNHGIALGGRSDVIRVFGGAGHCTSKEEKLSHEISESGGLYGQHQGAARCASERSLE